MLLLLWIDSVIKTIIQMRVRRHISPPTLARSQMSCICAHSRLCVWTSVLKSATDGQSTEGGKAFPLERPLSLITSDCRLSGER